MRRMVIIAREDKLYIFADGCDSVGFDHLSIPTTLLMLFRPSGERIRIATSLALLAVT